jgi:hypothetical protein
MWPVKETGMKNLYSIYSTEAVLQMIEALRQALTSSEELDPEDYMDLCEDASEMIEAMLHHEMSHGLRKPIDEEEKDHE